jgi:hypothetical protein
VAIEAGQWAVGTAATKIAAVPAGPCTVIISNTSGGPVYLGGTAVSAADGFPVPSGQSPFAIPGYLSSSATQLWASAGSAVTIGVIISTDT